MDTTDELLKKYWGYASFLPLQKEIIDSVLKGQDTLAIMATGGGKSLCYPLPALYLDGLTIVISPLIALMKDQVDDLNARGIPAAAFDSSLDYDDRKKIETDLKNNRVRLLFLSPEKCMQTDFLAFLKKSPVCLFAVDEAHCISEWGHHQAGIPPVIGIKKTLPVSSPDRTDRHCHTSRKRRHLPAAGTVGAP